MRKSFAALGTGLILSLTSYEFFTERQMGMLERGSDGEGAKALQLPAHALGAQVEASRKTPGRGSSSSPSNPDSSADVFVDEADEVDMSKVQAAYARTKWHVGRQFLVPVMESAHHFRTRDQKVSADESCRLRAKSKDDLLADLELTEPSHVRPKGGELQSYYRYFLFEGGYYFLRGTQFGEEKGFRLDLLVSDSIVDGKEKWEPIALPGYRGETLSEEQFYKAAEAVEDDYASRGAVLASRSVLKLVKHLNAPDGAALVGLYNAEVTSLTVGELNCEIEPGEQSALHCSCPK